MSGIGMTTYNMRRGYETFVNKVRESYRKRVEQRRMKAEKKKEIVRVKEAINRSHNEMAEGIRRSMGEKDREAAEKFEKELERARNDLSRLQVDLMEAEKLITDTEEKARVSVGEQRAQLYRDLDAYKRQKAEMDRKAEEIRAQVERNTAELKRIVESMNSEIALNHRIIIDDMHNTAQLLMDRITANMAYDEFADYAYTVAMMEVEAIIKGASVDRYEQVMDQLKAMNEFLDGTEQKVADALRSYVIIDGIKMKLEKAFGDRKDCRFQIVGSPTSMVHIRITFSDCITDIRMFPDGKGGFRSSLVNTTPGVNDRKVHDEICARYCRIIGEAAELDIDYSKQAMSEKEIAEAEREVGRSPEERAAATRKNMRERTGRA